MFIKMSEGVKFRRFLKAYSTVKLKKINFSSDWLIVELYNNRIHNIFMDNDNISSICDNDIICAFEIRNNANPLAVYLQYEGELAF